MIFFKRKKPKLDFQSEFAVIRTTNPAINSFVNDKFNKNISIFRNWDDYKRNNPISEIPYTEIDVKNIREIFKIPIIDEDLELNFNFTQETNFGEVVNRA